MRPSWRIPLALLVIFAACGGDGGHSRSDASQSPDAATEPFSIPLTVSYDGDGLPVRLYVPATWQDKSGCFLVDTASQFTFIFMPDSPDGVDAGTATIGSLEVPVIGRPHGLAETCGDEVTFGILGNDVLMASAWEIDYERGLLVRHDELPEVTDWWRTSVEDINGFIFADVTLDGEQLYLAVDTGAAHTLWVGQDGRPGDQPAETQDAYGNPLTFYLGSGTIALGSEPAREVVVMRAPSFPSFEDSNKQQGLSVDGLVGVSSFGRRNVLFNGPAGEVRWAPN